MPSPGNRSAPKFDGHPPSLKRFFDEVDYLGDSYGLSAVEKIQHTLHYLDFREYETWRSRPSARGSNWDIFKAEITALYPGADEDRKYTVVDLEILVDKQGHEPIQSRYQFGEYYQHFVTISDWLLSQQEISIQDRNKLFIRGFDHSFRDRLTSRLCMKNPDHPLHRPWPMDDVTESARFFLASNSAASELDHYSYPSYNSRTHFSAQAPPPRDLPPLAQERFDMSSLEQYMVSDAFVSKLADKLGLNKTTAHSSNFSSQHATSRPQQPRPDGCVGCLDSSHYHQSCPIIADYISRGLCKRDNMKRVVLMDGTLVTTCLAPGKCIKERIDNWLKSCAPPTVSTNIVEAVSTTPLSLTSDILSQEVCTSEVSPADLKELHLLDTVAVSTLKQADTIRKRISEASKAKSTSYPATRAAVKTGKASLNPIVTLPASAPQ